jgi:hypothetical protein
MCQGEHVCGSGCGWVESVYTVAHISFPTVIISQHCQNIFLPFLWVVITLLEEFLSSAEVPELKLHSSLVCPRRYIPSRVFLSLRTVSNWQGLEGILWKHNIFGQVYHVSGDWWISPTLLWRSTFQFSEMGVFMVDSFSQTAEKVSAHGIGEQHPSYGGTHHFHL